MSPDNALSFMRQMLEHATEAVAIAKGKSRADLDNERQLNLWLARSLEVMGEAAARVPEEDRNGYPGIPWAEIISMRERFVHGYNAIDFDILWQIVTQDLPVVIESLRKTLPDA